MIATRLHAVVLSALLCVPAVAVAQGPPGRGGPPQPPPTARAGASVDLTGYWVSVITEDWRWRMVTPIKGDVAGIPLTPEAREVADAWDPARDEAAGLACKAYGAAAIMRRPGRVRITWQDDQALKLEFDEGTQTRIFNFGTVKPVRGARPSWQGVSVANWERPLQGIEPPDRSGIFAVRTGTGGRSLEVRTTGLRDGYLRKNGVPYSADTLVEEFFDYRRHPDNTEWFTVTTMATD